MSQDNYFADLQNELRALPPTQSIVPFIKHVLLLAPPDGCLDQATRDSIRAWDEPAPTSAQVAATRAAYAAGPYHWDKLKEMLDLLQRNVALREMLRSMQ